MQIEQVETFLDLCETNSFNQTAERLQITQSTVSGRVKALENHLGRKLFTRSRSGTSLTLEGLRFEPHARALRLNWAEALRATRDTGPMATTLRVGVQRDLTSTRIVNWVKEFRETLPDTSLYVEANFSVQMCNDLMRGVLDVAMIYTPTPHPDLFFESVANVPFRMVSDQATRLEDVPVDSYVKAGNSPAIERLHKSMLPRLEEAPIGCGQDSLISSLLLAHGGSGYVMESTAKDLMATGRFSIIRNAPTLPQPVYSAIHLRNRHRSSHRKLIQLLVSHFPGHRD